MSQNRQLTILLVEDDPDHVMLIKRNLHYLQIANEVDFVRDGQQALDYLFGRGAYANRSMPSPLLVLLDLDLPEVDGYEVLRRMKADEHTRHIPVIILTSSDDSKEMARCYELGCNVFVTKPLDPQEFSEAVYKMGLMLSIVKVPEGK